MSGDLVQRNMILSFEFSRYLLEHPEIEVQIPEGASVVLLPEDDPELCEYNKQISGRERVPGQPVVYIRLGALLPEQRSRLSDVRIEPTAVS